MAEPHAAKVALTINAPPELEEALVDWLLERDGAGGFTSYAASGHGTQHERLSVAEQVSGRQRRIEFRVAVREDALDGFITALAREFRGVDLYWFVTPVLRSGHLRGSGT